ncbi:MAG: proline racemase family protein [Sulfolobales archaeon]
MRSLSFIEVHNSGMPVRIVFAPGVPGSNMKEKKAYCEKNLDWIRKLLTYEPRASSSSYGVLVTNPTSSEAHIGALFFDSSGWHDMCGHASMGLACYLVRSGLVGRAHEATEIRLETPAGIVKLSVDPSGKVTLVNVPSFVVGDARVKSSKFGDLTVHLAYGGNLYGIVDLDELGINWDSITMKELAELSGELWSSVSESAKSLCPYELYGFRFSKNISLKPLRYYGILVFGSPQRPLLDRSPSGTGSSAHLAYLYSRGFVRKMEFVEFVSAISTTFLGRVVGETAFEKWNAVVPEISTATRACYITAYTTVILEPDDPLGEGFTPLPI